MFYIEDCQTNKILTQTHDKAEAFKLAASLMHDNSDTCVTDTSRGYSRIIGFGSTGEIPESDDQTDPCTRGGSVLLGRETE